MHIAWRGCCVTADKLAHFACLRSALPAAPQQPAGVSQCEGGGDQAGARAWAGRGGGKGGSRGSSSGCGGCRCCSHGHGAADTRRGACQVPAGGHHWRAAAALDAPGAALFSVWAAIATGCKGNRKLQRRLCGVVMDEGVSSVLLLLLGQGPVRPIGSREEPQLTLRRTLWQCCLAPLAAAVVPHSISSMQILVSPH